MTERKLFKNLPPVPRKRVLEYVDAPSFEGWRAVRDIPVLHGQTLADLVDQVDRCYHLYPDSLLIARTSRYAEKKAAELLPFDDDNFVDDLLSELIEREPPTKPGA